MPALNSTARSKTSRVLIYGAPNTGKTLLAAKLSEHFNLLWFDLESGIDVARTLPEEWQARINVISLPDTKTYPIAIETMLKVVKGPVDICTKHGKVKCMICQKLVNDMMKETEGEISTEADDMITHVDVNSLSPDTIVVMDTSTQLTASAIAHITKGKDDDYKMKTDDWGSLSKLMEVFYSHIQNASYNVIVITHETNVADEGKPEKMVPIAGSKPFSRNVAKSFSDTVYAQIKNKKYKFASSANYAQNINASSRSGVVLEDMDEPSLLAIFKPEVAPTTTSTSSIVKNTSSASATPNSKAASILDRLKNVKT